MATSNTMPAAHATESDRARSNRTAILATLERRKVDMARVNMPRVERLAGIMPTNNPAFIRAAVNLVHEQALTDSP